MCHHAAIGFFICCSVPAVDIPSAPSVTTDVGVHSVFGVPAVTSLTSFLSAFDTGGKFAAAVVVNTGGKFAVVNKNLWKDVTTGVDDIGGKFSAGFVDSGGNLPPVSLIQLVHLTCKFTNKNDSNFIIMGLGEMIHEKNLEQNIS